MAGPTELPQEVQHAQLQLSHSAHQTDGIAEIASFPTNSRHSPMQLAREVRFSFFNLHRRDQVPPTTPARTPTMVFRRANVLVVGIATLSASTTASPDLGRLVLEHSNRTETTAGMTVLAAAPRLFSYCGADIVGGDMFAKRYPSPDDCVTNCLPSTGCNAGTWTKFEGGTCYFKRLTKKQTEYLNIVPKAGAVSFLLYDDNTPYEIQYPVFNVDMPGNDLSNFPVGPTNGDGIPRCHSACQQNGRCNAWTWSTYNGGTCYLKTKPSPYVSSSNSDSGIVGHDRNAAACLAYI